MNSLSAAARSFGAGHTRPPPVTSTRFPLRHSPDSESPVNAECAALIDTPLLVYDSSPRGRARLVRPPFESTFRASLSTFSEHSPLMRPINPSNRLEATFDNCNGCNSRTGCQNPGVSSLQVHQTNPIHQYRQMPDSSMPSNRAEPGETLAHWQLQHVLFPQFEHSDSQASFCEHPILQSLPHLCPAAATSANSQRSNRLVLPPRAQSVVFTDTVPF